MKARKLQIVGKRSYTITLPKSWVSDNKLGPHDSIIIERTPNNELLIKAGKDFLPKGTKVTAQKEDIKGMERFLRFCYMKNIDTVTIFSKHFDPASVREIKQAIKHIDGYGVTGENPTSMEISFLYHDIDVRLERIIRRMLYMLTVMMESLRVKDYETLDEIEDTVDGLYLLAKRVLLRCMNSSKVREDNQLHSNESVLFLWICFKKMENIADTLRDLRHVGITQTEDNFIQTLIKLLEKAFYRPSMSTELLAEAKAVPKKGITTERLCLITIIHKEAIDILHNVDHIHLNDVFFSDKKEE